LGILLVAKRRGLVEAIRPIVDALINEAGFRVSSQLYADVLAMADEDE
jgi:predicted nucleic acid-binding protein